MFVERGHLLFVRTLYPIGWVRREGVCRTGLVRSETIIVELRKIVYKSIVRVHNIVTSHLITTFNESNGVILYLQTIRK